MLIICQSLSHLNVGPSIFIFNVFVLFQRIIMISNVVSYGCDSQTSIIAYFRSIFFLLLHGLGEKKWN